VRHATGYLGGIGGRRIFWQSWAPDGEPRALIVIVHGAGEHSDRYADVAGRLVSDCYGVHALDHRGHGRSDGPRALIDRLDNAVADLDQLVSLASGSHPGLPVFMLGHSMGGTVALRYATSHQDRLSGLILSGALAALEAAPAPLRLAANILSVVTPTLGLISVDASQVSRDSEVVSAYVADPLVHHGKLPVRTVAELAAAIDGFPSSVTSITIPTLILYGTADGLCPAAGSVMLGERIGSPDKIVKPYEGLFHEILNEPERDAVLADILGWLADRVSAAAPGEGASSPAGSSTS
jgi:acylglycerol lipase